jgi:hypothetical protein
MRGSYWSNLLEEVQRSEDKEVEIFIFSRNNAANKRLFIL